MSTFFMCVGLHCMFLWLEVHLPHDHSDPLSLLCETIAPPTRDLYEYLLNDHSKHARFYRWVKKMKKQWNIEEEKLVITVIAGAIVCLFITIIFTGFPYL